MMELKRAGIKDAEEIWKLQTEAFAQLLARYEDYDTSPGSETMERIEIKLRQPFTYFYFMEEAEGVVGAIRLVDRKDGSRKRISPLFVMKEYRNKGYAQSAITEAEKIHGQDNWELDTILQEEGNCFLYEKMGYHRTGKSTVINEKMTIVYYEKN